MGDALDIDLNMHNVVQDGNLQEVETLVNTYSLSYCAEWDDGYSLLSEALAHKHLDVATFLISNHCKVHIENPAPASSPLYFAVKNNYTKIVQILLSKGATAAGDLNEMLHFAIKNGNPKIVFYFMKLYNDVKNYKDERGYTMLHFAVQKNSDYLFFKLLRERVWINAQDKNGVTPLHIAANKGYEYIVVRLIGVGASINLEYNEPMFDDGKNNELENGNETQDSSDDASINANSGLTALHIAVFRGHKRIVEFLLKHKAEVNCKSKFLNTPLHFTTSNKHVKIAQLLLKFGADCTLKNNKGITPLHCAAKAGLKHIVHALLDSLCINNETLSKCKHYVNLESTDGTTALHLAAQSGDVEIVRLLLKHGADLNAICMKGMTALHYAATTNDVILVRFLVGCNGVNYESHSGRDKTYVYKYRYTPEIYSKRKAYVNLQSKEGLTALHVAAGHGSEDVSRLLLFCGADLDTKCSNRMTSLHYAAKTKKVLLTKLLLKNFTRIHSRGDSGGKMPHDATSECMTEMHLKRKAYVNSRSKDGRTALHIAAGEGSVGVARLLLAYGADISIKCSMGMTVLHYVAKTKNFEFARLLIQQITKIDSTCPNRKNFAPPSVCECTAEMLLKCRAYINIKSKDGRTALHFASEGTGSADVAKLLLEYGGDANIKCKKGCTALHYAATAQDAHITSHLLKNNADVNATCNAGDTPLCCAIRILNVQAVHFLLAYDADINIKNKKNYTAFSMLLSKNTAPEMLRSLLSVYIIRRKMAGLYVSNRNMKFMKRFMSHDEERWKEIQIAYLKEVKRLADKVIIKNAVSLYDILMCPNFNQIARYACNEDAFKIMSCIDCNQEFPIYANLLEKQLSEGFRRKILLEQLDTCSIALPMLLPPECIELITNYLSNNDLENFIQACQPLKQCSLNSKGITFPNWQVLRERFTSIVKNLSTAKYTLFKNSRAQSLSSTCLTDYDLENLDARLCSLDITQ